MADPVRPTPKAGMDPNFEKRLRDLRQHAAALHEALRGRGRHAWFRPGGWDGDLRDYEALAAAFDRSRANDDYLKAVKDPGDPGTTGDVVVTLTQIETLAVLERAYRNRLFLRRCRAAGHLAGRLRGQGDPRGPFVRAFVEYVRGLLRQQASPDTISDRLVERTFA